METGDWGLVFFAKEPADKDERVGGGLEKEGKFKGGQRFLSRWMRQRESAMGGARGWKHQ